MKKIGEYIEILKENEQEFYPRYNDFVIEVIEEKEDKEQGTRHSLWLYIPTLHQRLTKPKTKKLRELMDCNEILLLNELQTNGNSRKIAIGYWDTKFPV